MQHAAHLQCPPRSVSVRAAQRRRSALGFHLTPPSQTVPIASYHDRRLLPPPIPANPPTIIDAAVAIVSRLSVLAAMSASAASNMSSHGGAMAAATASAQSACQRHGFKIWPLGATLNPPTEPHGGSITITLEPSGASCQQPPSAIGPSGPREPETMYVDRAFPYIRLQHAPHGGARLQLPRQLRRRVAEQVLILLIRSALARPRTPSINYALLCFV
jgi:hypothetical protein